MTQLTQSSQSDQAWLDWVTDSWACLEHLEAILLGVEAEPLAFPDVPMGETPEVVAMDVALIRARAADLIPELEQAAKAARRRLVEAGRWSSQP